MAFGKRSADDPRPAPPIVDQAATSKADGVLSVRTRVANPGGIDTGFISLAVGVVLVSAGGALAAPSLFSMLGGPSARPISEIVAGLDHNHAKAALAAEAFPDQDGSAFMQLLEDNFPESHNRLLDKLASAATQGADRDDLVLAVNLWGMEFVPGNLEYVGRTGAEGFDSLLTVASDALDVLNSEMGGCSLDKFTALAADPVNLTAFTSYGSRGYATGMRANHKLVELAARGRNAPKPDSKLNATDESAIQSVLVSFLSDPALMNAMQTAVWQTRGNAEDMQRAVASKIDVCQLGRSLVVKLKRMPSGTKSRILAALTSGDLMSMPGPMMGFPGMGGMGSDAVFGPPAGLPPEVMKRLAETL